MAEDLLSPNGLITFAGTNGEAKNRHENHDDGSERVLVPLELIPISVVNNPSPETDIARSVGNSGRSRTMKSTTIALVGLALLALTLSPRALLAETCGDPSGGISWTAVGDGAWEGCTTPDGTDAFQIDEAQVNLAGDVTMAAGGLIEVTGSGVLTGAGPNSLTLGDRLVVEDGGRLEFSGHKLGECQVVAEIDWSYATSVTHTYDVTLDCDLNNVMTATDWVRWKPVDPPGGVSAPLNDVGVCRGGDPPESCDFRPAYAGGIWHPITSVSNQVLTLDLNRDASNYVGSNNYDGTRHVPTAGDPATLDDTAEVDSCNVNWMGSESEIVFDDTFDMVARDGDLGSRYVAFTSAFGGTHHKILDADNDFYAGTDVQCDSGSCDRIVVSGDICSVTGGEFHITQG
jgi:hypothetical protein